MNANINNRLTPQQREAIQNLRIKMQTIPNSDDVFQMMVTDWIDNTDEGDLDEEVNNRGRVVRRAFSYEDIRELVEESNEESGENAPPFTNDDYKKMYNFFSTFVREYYRSYRSNAIIGGKRRNRRNRRQSRKKSRRSNKKTRKH